MDQAGKTMDEIVGSIQQVRDIVAEITAASIEQSSGVQQIGQAIDQMDQVTQQNAALVEEGAAAAESLKAQARQLVQSVSAFQLGAQPNGLIDVAPQRVRPAPPVATKGSGRRAVAAERASAEEWASF